MRFDEGEGGMRTSGQGKFGQSKHLRTLQSVSLRAYCLVPPLHLANVREKLIKILVRLTIFRIRTGKLRFTR